MSFAAVDAADSGVIFRTLAAELFGVFGIDSIHICRLADDDTLGQGTVYAQLPDGTVDESEYYVVPFDRPSGVHHVLATGAPLSVFDTGSSEVVSRELCERYNVASMLYVPLSYERGVRAVVLLLSHSPRRFAGEEVDLVHTMANHAAGGLAALDLRTRLGARAETQAALARAARTLNESLERHEVLDTLCREAVVALGADLSGVYLGDAESGGVAVAAHGLTGESDWWGYRITAGEGVAGRVLVSGEPVVSNDYQDEVDVPGVEVMRSVRTAVSVPMYWNGALRGALSVAFFSVRRVEAGELDTLQAIASLAAAACGKAEAYEAARAAARTDSLTGLLNHGAIQVRTAEEIWRVRRGGHGLTCLLADLDNFKPINDRHGHAVGDEILKRVATALGAEFRPYDGVARYGGDEFVVLLPGTDEAGGLAAAHRLRVCVARTGEAFGDLGMPVTASVGVAEWTEPLTAGELLDRADRALLLAKRRGKDALVVASSHAELELAGLETGSAPSQLMNSFWSMVARCDQPSEVLDVMPSFIRRELELEEVAFYEPSDTSGLARVAGMRAPGDPAPAAFHPLLVAPVEELSRRLRGGSITRPSLPELRRALGIEAPAESQTDPRGSFAAVAVARAGEVHGVLLLRHSGTEFPRTCVRLTEMVVGQAMTVLLGQAGGGSRNAVAALAAAIDARDNYTLSHSRDVVDLACAVAGRLGLSRAETASVHDGAILHDVGKVAIPNEILYKEGPLDDTEWEVMRQHPVIGERILLRTPELEPIAPLVRHEHERWDGLGYPDGLAGRDIPAGSRIIFACDAYNAMITQRPYRAPMSHDEALEELRRGSGTQFDPDVVSALVEVLSLRPRPLEKAAAR
jgi:diguanylate cyclase (GGDEF)-like protein